MDLNGTVNTPVGSVSKKTALAAGVGAAILAIVWYRGKKASQATAAAGSSEINPATGYPYGSAEDAAALSAQAGYQFPTGSGGGGGGGSGTDVIATNDQWVQKVLAYWQDHDLGDPTKMSAALGKYLAGSKVTSDELSLIQQAQAIAGIPPKEGPNGYPPHINTSNDPTPPSGGGGNPKTYPAFTLSVTRGEKVTTFTDQIRAKNGFDVDWGLIEGTNPGLAGNVNWVTDINARTFKNNATYTIPSVTR